MLRVLIVVALSLQLLSCTAGPAVKKTEPGAVVAERKVAVAAAEPVSGKVKIPDGEMSAAGIRILVWPVSALSLAEPPAYVAPVSADSGQFNLNLPMDSYYFVAESEGLYSFYGRNPVTVPAGGIEDLKFSLVEREPPVIAAPEDLTSGAFGQLTVSGKPLAGAVVSVYVDLTSQLKGLGLGMTAPTDASGIFRMEMPAGTYYLVARKRSSGSVMGPLAAGDFVGHFSGNPVRVKTGQVVAASIAMIEVPESVNRISDEIFGSSSISGRVVDAKGQPLSGIRVLLYDNSMMLNRPLFVSQPSAADGTYVISFPQGGTYWLAARSQLGGPPLPGEQYGRYLASPDGSVQLTTGQHLKDVELVAEQMK